MKTVKPQIVHKGQCLLTNGIIYFMKIARGLLFDKKLHKRALLEFRGKLQSKGSIKYFVFLSHLADSVYSTQTPGIIDRSVEGNSQSMETTITTSLSSETNTKNHIINKETTLQKSKINTNYLLAGSGAVIFMLFVVIVIQSIRKSKSVKRKHETGDEPFRQPPNGHNKKYWNITSSKQSNHFYQHVDSVYQEIDESVELMPIPASTEKTNELGDHNLSKCINNSISNVTEHDDLNAQMPKESTCLNTDKADYLEPVFVRANVEIESKQEIHSYMTG